MNGLNGFDLDDYYDITSSSPGLLVRFFRGWLSGLW
jgi:hypothetical protein